MSKNIFYAADVKLHSTRDVDNFIDVMLKSVQVIVNICRGFASGKVPAFIFPVGEK